jgi:hypothetical protein
MLKYQNLRFFNGTSGELDFLYDENLQSWSGTIFMPKVSTGLYETVNLFVFEEVIVNSGVLEYVRPISENVNSSKILFEFQNDFGTTKDIFLYDAVVDKDEYVISQFESKTDSILNNSNNLGIIAYNQTNNTLGTISGSIDFKGTSDYIDKTPLSCNIALMSDQESIHYRSLYVYEIENGVKKHLIADIQLYGETEAEDERLSILLSNLGMSIKEEEGLIFRHTDINEIATDWKLINNKRKELLLEGHNILPFVGTYKALLNAIKFYGYDNLTLKEYWLNINEQSSNFGKLLAVAVPNQEIKGFLADKSNKIELPNSNHKKTSRFSLVYRLNEPTGELDEWDLPKVKETSEFTPAEVLIKLYGLKKKLQSTYLPLQSKIVDITAEGDFFTQFTQNTWNNQNTIQVQNSGIEVDFEVFPKRRLFIEDLRLVSQDLATNNLIFPLTNNTSVISDIKNFYKHYYDKELNTFPTLSNVPIGCPIVLEATSLEDIYNDADYTWNDADLASNDYTQIGSSIYNWDNIWSRDVYEIEWIITGPNNYEQSFRAPVADIYNMALVLPYVGSYNVILNMYDLYNARSFTVKNSEIVIENKAVEIYGMYEWKNHKESWNDQKYTWDLAGGFFDFSQDSPIQIDEMLASWYLTLDRANYVYDEKSGLQFSTVRRYLDSNTPTGFAETTGPYVWKYLKNHTWNDSLNVTWNSTRVGSDLAASFKIHINQSDGFNNGSLNIKWRNPGTQNYIIETYTIQSVYPLNANNVSAWQNVADELNSLTYQTNPIFSKFNWNPVLFDSNGDGTVDQCLYILAVAKEYSSSYDYENVYFTNQSSGLVDGFVRYTAYNPTWNDVVIFNDHAKVTLMTHMTFSFDKSNMPGIVSYKWKLTNVTDNNIQDVETYSEWFTYLFNARGDYKLTLELIDSNGNKNIISRNIVSIVKPEELGIFV